MSDIWLETSLLLNDIEDTIKDDLLHTVLYSHSIVEIYILAALYKQDWQRPMDLAAATYTAVTAMTPILDRLEGAELIERSTHPTDRRSVLISLTHKGKLLKDAVEHAIGNAEVRYGGG